VAQTFERRNSFDNGSTADSTFFTSMYHVLSRTVVVESPQAIQVVCANRLVDRRSQFRAPLKEPLQN
jgi:hypothetical protein